MGSIIHSDWYWHEEKGWRINSTKSGIRTDILRPILSQLSALLSYHRKVFVFRFDLHPPAYTDNNKLLTSFNRRLFRKIKRHYKINKIGFYWAREQEKAKRQHYHYVLFLDGSKINQPHRIQGWIEEIWQYYNGSAHWSGYHNVQRTNEQGIQKAAYHISYLAKTRGKGYRPAQTKDHGGSRLKPNPAKTGELQA